jgi:heme-degrading monooxygenase HmoA
MKDTPRGGAVRMVRRSPVPIAKTPEPPYYAVVFTSSRTEADEEGYQRMAETMEQLAATQPGYLGIESARGADGLGITVSYWASLDAIRAWRENAEHRVAQRLGKERWYRAYELRVCRVERAYGFGQS